VAERPVALPPAWLGSALCQPSSNPHTEALENRIATKIELIAYLICEGRSAVQPETDLRELERQLVREEQRESKAASVGRSH
jgi:hypothetical protein